MVCVIVMSLVTVNQHAVMSLMKYGAEFVQVLSCKYEVTEGAFIDFNATYHSYTAHIVITTLCTVCKCVIESCFKGSREVVLYRGG